MSKPKMKKIAAAFLILIVGRVAHSKDEKPSTYQQAFDKALEKVNDDIGIYARLSCTATSFPLVSDTLKADLANFSILFAKVPNDKEFIKNTEIGLGVDEFANYIMQRQAKKCTPNGVDPLREPSFHDGTVPQSQSPPPLPPPPPPPHQ